ncbi:MAG: hypothetical protein EVJ46_07655 [Candidatus Acididesulfobacter guangdongensis]|uniref:4-amino-4-deoxychorismate lyase n=1 Tax=Acididesulfobacter guangdongensis TaxID=2597225 RepID=A0A519BFL2_ACIG2|nr:MAG: hypothetical protein EVJ46_07655 [Candidatus Acididesulfobacter guangdongensis]
MCRFIETVKLENGNYKLIDYHNKRLNDTIIHFFKKNLLKSEFIDIGKFLPSPAAEFKKGIFKCRIVYSDKIESIEILPYIKKNIKRLKLVESDIDYSLKFENRDSINNLFNESKIFKNKNQSNLPANLINNNKDNKNSRSSDSLRRGYNSHDDNNPCGDDFDILIVKKGLITDTSYSNIILYDGKEWVTPESYLLNGVKRRYLLNECIIKEIKVRTADLKNFKKISLINAMLEPHDIEIDIDNIV